MMVQPDTLSLCVNANFMAEILGELADYQRVMAADPACLGREFDARRWVDRLGRWADVEYQAAATIRGLVAEVERLRSGGRPH